MSARTGKEFLEGLKKPREVWLGGERVSNIADHPAFAGAAQTLASIFDLQHERAEDCLMLDPETGQQVNISHVIPRSRADIERRHRCIQPIVEATVGLMGRTPDYMNITFAGFAGRTDEWAKHDNERGAANIAAYQKHIARNDLVLTHTIIQPTIDKSKGESAAAGDDVALHKIADTQNGIVVRGARVLATLAPFADELAVYPMVPLPEGAEAYALAFCIPMGTPGLKFLCRDSCSIRSNLFDHPLSSRFDEQDAFVIFDDVEIPKDRIFIDGNLAAYNSVMSTSWAPNMMQQTMMRAQTKLEFAYGLATRMTQAINDTSPATRQLLGEIWTYAELTRAAVFLAEAESYEYGNGMWAPRGGPLMALRAALPTWFPRVVEIITLIGSHNLLAAPTQAQLRDPSIKDFVARYMRGAGEVGAEDRARIFRLAWDFVGSGLASRNSLYERFYLSSGARSYMTANAFAPKDRALMLVDGILAKEPTGR